MLKENRNGHFTGFTVDDNPHDMLMLRCPLPPMADWNEVLRARVALLQRRGLSPQLFLHAADIRGSQGVKASFSLLCVGSASNIWVNIPKWVSPYSHEY